MARSGAGVWIAAAFFSALAVAVAVLTVAGTAEPGILLGLRLSARVSFLLFWMAYAGGALAALFGTPFVAVARHGRDFGLAFASAHLVHLGLVVWLFRISDNPPISNSAIVLFSLGVVWLYALTLLSVKRIRDWFNPRFARIFQNRGLDYLALLFLADFVVSPLRHGLVHPIGYAPFSLLAIAGPLLRAAAMVQKWRDGPRAAMLSR
jgi:hypothetical protein